jgi:hypothetical protein
MLIENGRKLAGWLYDLYDGGALVHADNRADSFVDINEVASTEAMLLGDSEN